MTCLSSGRRLFVLGGSSFRLGALALQRDRPRPADKDGRRKKSRMIACSVDASVRARVSLRERLLKSAARDPPIYRLYRAHTGAHARAHVRTCARARVRMRAHVRARVRMSQYTLTSLRIARS